MTAEAQGKEVAKLQGGRCECGEWWTARRCWRCASDCVTRLVHLAAAVLVVLLVLELDGDAAVVEGGVRGGVLALGDGHEVRDVFADVLQWRAQAGDLK